LKSVGLTPKIVALSPLWKFTIVENTSDVGLRSSR